MPESQPIELNPAQVATLQRLLDGGFQLTSVEHVARYVAMEKNGFIALLEPAQAKIRLFGQIGYRVGNGIGMLVDRGGRPVFVWKKSEVEASPELLAAYQQIKTELTEILEGEAKA